MDSVNVNFSVNNLPQMERNQSEVHRTPIVNQEQNARLAADEADARLAMPVEADAIEKKNIDPDDKKERQEQWKNKNRRRDGRKPDEEPPPAVTGPFSVDVQA
ncbi:MAG: hypothetical protein JW863_14725 [Chitinispirillaceae bacterium]|nr:hypothetical protein [Chitinispirillaceae bacterium]